MKLVPSILLCAAVVFLWPSQKVNPDRGHDCAMVQEALSRSREIKPGMTRRDVERYFAPDGGLQFPNRGVYVFSSCRYLKIEVDFDLKPSGKASLLSRTL